MTKLEDIIRTLIGFFVVIMFGSVAGAASGWAVSLILNETVLTTLAAFGVKTSGLELWEIGATLGFIGAFFKPTCGPLTLPAGAPEEGPGRENVVTLDDERQKRGS